MTEILLAIITGLIAMLAWGIGDFFAKKSIDDIGEYATLFWGHIYGCGFFLAILYDRVVKNHAKCRYPENPNEWLSLIFFGTLQAIIYLLLYRGFRKGQLSILNTIFASYSGITVLLSILLFNEKLAIYSSLSLMILFIGIILMNLDSKALIKGKISFIKTPGLVEVIIATVLAAIWTILWSDFVDHRDAFTYSFYMYFIMTAAIVLWCLFKRVKLISSNDNGWAYCVFIGLLECTAYIAVSTGYRWTHYTSIVALLSGAFSLPVVILSRIFLWEIPTRIQYIGIALVIIGIVLLSFS